MNSLKKISEFQVLRYDARICNPKHHSPETEHLIKMITYTEKCNSIFEVTVPVPEDMYMFYIIFKKLQIQHSRKVETTTVQLSFLNISLQLHA